MSQVSEYTIFTQSVRSGNGQKQDHTKTQIKEKNAKSNLADCQSRQRNKTYIIKPGPNTHGSFQKGITDKQNHQGRQRVSWIYILQRTVCECSHRCHARIQRGWAGGLDPRPDKSQNILGLLAILVRIP